MNRKTTRVLLSCCLVMAGAVNGLAGGALETIDVTGFQESPFPGFLTVRMVGIKWDSRCIPVRYSMNDTLDPIPTPSGTPGLSVADVRAGLQRAFDAWNEIPTSFIDMKITGTTDNPGLRGFDFVNELTFHTPPDFPAIASSPSTALMLDATFTPGDDIDGDGDSDVAAGIRAAADVDGDGDLEFPAGFYKAGTILDNDVQFSTNFTYTVADEAVNPDPFSVDLTGLAAHEFGHSHGLSHTLDNQISENDGNGSTMYPFIDTGDPATELAIRSLSEDDKAWSSYFYPEGSAASGPGAIRPGDLPFKFRYGLIKGELRHGVLDQPIAGGNLFAVNELTGERIVSSFSGRTRLVLDQQTGELAFSGDPAFDIIDGGYVIPVPLGLYSVGVEPVDETPVEAFRISLTTQIGAFYGQQNFNEEFYSGKREDAHEVNLGRRVPVLVIPGQTRSGIDLVTSDSINLNNFGPFAGFVGLDFAESGYAVQVPASQLTAVNSAGELLIQGVAFGTGVARASGVPVFAKAMLTTGLVNPDNSVTIDLAHPLELKEGFVGQDNDFAPLYFKDPRALGRKVMKGIATGEIQHLFIVLQGPVISLPNVPIVQLGLGGPPLSFLTFNGGATWNRLTDLIPDLPLSIRFSLIVSTQSSNVSKR